jgi:hypothetical protein
MVRAEYSLPVGEVLLIQRDGLLDTVRAQVGAGQVVAGRQGVGVTWAEYPLPVGEILLLQGDGLIDAARLLVGDGQRRDSVLIVR